MAVVFGGRDTTTTRAVAIKVIRHEFAAALGRARFQREIRLLSELNHPGILPLIDSGEAGTLLFYMMPLVEGETLQARLEREPQLPLDTARRITTQIAVALDYAHDRGVVHRDIKPSNLFVSGDRVLVADFGIAKELTPPPGEITTSTGLIVGTVEYMSPEQADSHLRVDRRSDVYALGCVAYEMLAGEPPFTGPSMQAVVARHRAVPPPLIRVVRPDLPEGVDLAIHRALAKSPADRFQRAGDFAAALSGSAAPAAEVTSARPGGRRTLRWLMLGATTVLGIVLVILLRPRTPPLDPQKVIGYPLVETGAPGPASDAGELVAILIGRALEHAEPLKWLDGWSRIPIAARQDIRLLSAEQARAAGRRSGAGYYLSGRIIHSGDSTLVALQLHDVASDSVVGQASAAGLPGASLPRLGFQALVSLLPSLLGEGRGLDAVTVQAFEGRSPAAVANWLQGEREFRRSRYVAALALLSRAVEQDSSLALAALRGAEAADWLEAHEEAAALVAVARRAGAGLPAKYAEYATGLEAYLAGDADSAVTAYHRALAIDSLWAPGWMALGETYFHLLPSSGDPDSAALSAFSRARNADPSLAPPLYHLFDLALYRGDVERADSLYGAYRAFAPDSSWTTDARLRLACARDPKRVHWETEALEHPVEVVSAAKMLLAHPPYWPCADLAFRATRGSSSPAVRWGATFGLTSLLLAERRTSDAQAVLDSAVVGGLSGAMALYVAAAAAGFGMDDKAATAIAALSAPVDKLDAVPLWYHGIWCAHRGDTLGLRAVVARLDQLVAGTPTDLQVRGISDAIGARLALARLDTAGAVERLERVRSIVPRQALWWGIQEPYALERLLLARLLAATGRFEEALTVTEVLGHHGPVMFLPLLPASLTLRVELAQRLGVKTRARADQAMVQAFGSSRTRTPQ
jgi:serine/threonine-protein kinase